MLPWSGDDVRKEWSGWVLVTWAVMTENCMETPPMGWCSCFLESKVCDRDISLEFLCRRSMDYYLLDV